MFNVLGQNYYSEDYYNDFEKALNKKLISTSAFIDNEFAKNELKEELKKYE